MVDIRRREPDNLTRAHGLDMKLLHPWAGLATPFRGAWCVLRPGDVSDRHSHREQELFVAMAGRAEVVVGDERREIVAGDLMLLPANVEHHILNPHDDADFSYYAIWWDRVMSTEFLADMDQR